MVMEETRVVENNIAEAEREVVNREVFCSLKFVLEPHPSYTP
jgi:hypothetical protein